MCVRVCFHACVWERKIVGKEEEHEAQNGGRLHYFLFHYFLFQTACIVIITSAFRWSTLTSNLLIFCGWLVWCHSPWCQNFQKIQNNECNVVSVKHRNKILMLPYMLLSVVFIKPVVHVNQTLSLIHGLLGKRLNRWPTKTLLHIHPSLCDSLNTRKH